MHKVYIDYNGRRFESAKEMCTYHGVTKSTYSTRLRRGYSLKECLSSKPFPTGAKGEPCSDHEGRQFKNKKEMCAYHGVSSDTYDYRLRLGLSLKECLSSKSLPMGIKGEPCSDHEGRQFKNKKEMCDYHGVNMSTYNLRRKQGYSVEESLVNKTLRSTSCTDHNDRQFESIKAMCDYHGILESTYLTRRSLGYSVEESLSKDLEHRGISCSDHKGRQFKSVQAMCDYHGVSRSTYETRRRRGYSVEESLSKDLEHKGTLCSDHKGRQFKSVQAMCDYHGVSRNTYESRRKRGCSVEESLAKNNTKE